MIDIIVKTDDMLWATCFAGQLKSCNNSPLNGYKEVRFNFDSTKEEILAINDHIPKVKSYKNVIDVEKVNAEFTSYSTLHQRFLYQDTFEKHNIKNERILEQNASYLNVAFIYLAKNFRILGDNSKAWYPKLSYGKMCVHGICQRESQRPFCEGFCSAYVKNPVVQSLEEVTLYSAIKSLYTAKIVVSDLISDIGFVLHGQYEGFDNMKNTVPNFVTYDKETEGDFDYTRLVSYAGLKFYEPTAGYEEGLKRGIEWIRMAKYDFNAINMLKGKVSEK